MLFDLIKHALRVYWTALKNEHRGSIDTKISKELNMYTNYAKLRRNYHIYGINLRCGLRYTDFRHIWHMWAYDERKFREAKSADNAIPRSTRSVTKWAIKIFHEWHCGRQRGGIRIVLKNKLVWSLIWIRYKIWTLWCRWHDGYVSIVFHHCACAHIISIHMHDSRVIWRNLT